MSPQVRKYIALFALSMGAAASYNLPYIKYVFYDAWVAGLGLGDGEGANEKAGLLLSIYALTGFFLYIPGGYIADKFPVKKIIMFSLTGTGLLNIWYAFDPSYKTSLIIWGLLGVTAAFAYWSGMIKAVRLLGTPKEQGRMYGWYNSGEGFFASIFLISATFAYSLGVPKLATMASKGDMLLSLKYASITQGCACFLAAICTGIFFDEKLTKVNSDDDSEKFNIRDVGKVLKNPYVWVLSLIIACTYGAYTSQSYLTPYMTQVLQISGTMGAFFGILRTKGTRFLGGPIGGIIADRIGSPAKVIIVCNILISLLFCLFFIIPQDIAFANVIFITLTLVIATITFASYNIMFATLEEARIPRYLTGTAVGIISMIGYTGPDGILNFIFGGWMDKADPGSMTAYYKIIGAMIVMSIIGSIACYIIMKRGQAAKKEESLLQNNI